MGADRALISTLTPEDLLSATLTPVEMKWLAPFAEDWWPKFPEFNQGFDLYPGERFYIVQNYEQFSDVTDASLQAPLTLCVDAKSAKALYRSKAVSDAKGGIILPGPAVGDESRYSAALDRNKRYSTTLRYRVGEVVGRVSIYSNLGYQKPEVLARYAEPMVQRIRQLLVGRLKSAQIPQHIAALAPSELADKTVGPVAGFAIVPAKAWAKVDTLGQPLKVLDTLEKNGVIKKAPAKADKPVADVKVSSPNFK
jgi:hypothetical protein